jgi:hypothetical protein
MPGFDVKTAIIVLWGLTVLVLAWTWVPALIAALGGTRYLCGGTNDTHGTEAASAQPDYAFWAEQLESLGYEPIGHGWMRINFAGQDWSLFTPVRVFRNSQKQCFAFMQKAPAPYYFWPGAVFATCWADGGLLLSDNNLAAQPHPDDDFIKQGVVTLKLSDVEDLHLATMEVLKRRGRKPDAELNLETLLHAAERHFAPESKKHYGRAGTQYLFAHGLIHICVSAPAAYISGITHWTVPLANLVLALILLLGESAQKRQYARAVRAALRMRQALPVERRGEMEL